MRHYDACRGTFDPEIALQNDDIDFFAFGHPLVNAIVEELTSPSFRGRCTHRVVALPDSPGYRGLQFIFTVEYGGLRGYTEATPILLDLPSGVVNEHICDRVYRSPSLGRGQDEFVPVEDALRQLYRTAKTEVSRKASARLAEIQSQNDSLYDYEIARAERLHNHRAVNKHREIENLKNRISRGEESRDPDVLRVLPAWRGLLRAADREIEALEVQLQETLRQLGAKREISLRYSLSALAVISGVST
jgi:hypothetical protein